MSSYYLYVISNFSPKTYKKYQKWLVEGTDECFIIPKKIYPKPGEIIYYFGCTECQEFLTIDGDCDTCHDAEADYLELYSMRWRYVHI